MGTIDLFFESIAAVDARWAAGCVSNFQFVLDPAPESIPSLSYQNNCQSMEIRNQPGWMGLVAPGIVYIIPGPQTSTNAASSGRLLHRVNGRKSFGVVSIPGCLALGSPFAIALFQASDASTEVNASWS
jgi:hypothetical protein